jgi:soluble lytic murein transglycosylase-like protein
MTSVSQNAFSSGLALCGIGAALLLASDQVAAPDIARVDNCVPDKVVAAAQAVELDAAQKALVEYLSRRFYIAPSPTERVVAAAHRAARHVGLDPLLVLAVISVESRFNPIAESAMGAKGLMQIIPRYHRAKLEQFGGEEAVFDLERNIELGARILQEYVHRTGTLEAGLQFYNGAWRDNTAQYAQKVMAERSRIEEAVRAALYPPRPVMTALKAN